MASELEEEVDDLDAYGMSDMYGMSDCSDDDVETAKEPSLEDKMKLPIIFGSTKDLPEEHKNVIRIFLSSTFTDMKVERNMLMSSVFPRLKKYCQESYGLEFQVVDMRWGIQDQAADDHSTSELCMREIVNCRKESAGPNFVCFLGNRYGTRYLKKALSKDHWSIITSRIRDSKAKELLDKWYKLDTNSITPQYILQPLSSIENGADQWDDLLVIMSEAIREAAVQAKADGELSEDDAQQYIRSVTEEEIDCAGVFSDDDAQKANCLVFIRQIKDINLEHPKAKRFIDLTGSNGRDDEKQELLSKLTKKVRDKMPSENVKEYSVAWSANDGISQDDHKDYLQQFLDDFYSEVKRMIDTAAANEDQATKDVHEDEVCREVLAHSRLALDKLSKVVPRTDILDQIKSYVTGDSNRPMIVHGHSGCGKTSIMASVALEAGQWLNSADKTAVVLRFLGTTQASSDIELLLQSLNYQLHALNSMTASRSSCDDMASMTLKELMLAFHRRIKQMENKPNSKMVIVLDSIDQLRKNDLAFSLTWLPEKLPPNVKFIISTLPDIYGILKAAQSLALPSTNFVEVKTLDEQSAWAIINKWLEMSQRKLSTDQHEAINAAFKNRSLPPLYIKLIFDILIKWKSYDQATSIPTDVISCMEQLFSSLENTHGKLQVELALAYVSCSPDGISQSELEDTLSIDDVFLNEVFQYHLPPLRRIPPTLWVRIKNDISDYIVEKESNGVAAMYWYHRQFIEFATRRYATAERTKHCFETLSEYFTGKWSDIPKPFTYKKSLMERLRLTDDAGKAIRLVPAQPTRFSRHKFNARKVSVLSQVWSSEQLKDMVFQTSSRYIMDIEFLTAKFITSSWRVIDSELTAFTRYMEEQKSSMTSEHQIYSVEFAYIYAILSLYNGLIFRSPSTLSAQIFACLQDKYNMSVPIPPTDTTLPNLAWFLHQLTSGQGADMCPLVPVSKVLASPGGMQVLVRLSSSLGKLFPFTYNRKPAIAALVEDMVVNSIEDDGSITEALSVTVQNPSDFATHISYGEDENYLFAYASGTFRLISLENKRVEVNVDEVVVEPDDDDIMLTSESLKVFHNPLVKGRDSIMIYSFERELVVVYSMMLRKVVWYHYIPEERSDKEQVYYASVHDTEKEHLKELVVVLTGHTDVYTVELLENGGANVTEKETQPNLFVDEKNVSKSVRRLSSHVHGENQMNVVVPPDLPPNNRITISDRSVAQNNVWSYYDSSRKSTILMAGRLRSGVDVIVTRSESSGLCMTELYSAKGHDEIRLSAVFSTGKDTAASTPIVYLVPNSDVLMIAVNKMASFYFLRELSWPTIEVTFCFQILVDNESSEDILGDPRGYLVVNSQDNSTKFWDLTAFSDAGQVTENPRLRTDQTCMHTLGLPAPYNYTLCIQDYGHLWDVATNEYLGRLPGNFDDEQLICSNWYPGNKEWEFFVALISSGIYIIAGINPPKSSGDKLEMKMLHQHKPDDASEILLYDKGMLALSDEGMISNFQIAEMSVCKAFPLYISVNGTDVRWEKAGFTALEWCYTDKLLLVSGDKEAEGNDDIASDEDGDAFDTDDADPVSCILVFDASSFKLLKTIEETGFSYAAHFKNFNCTILVGSFSDAGLYTFDAEAMEVKKAQLPEEYKVDKISMLETYNKDECSYCTDKEPYFYVQVDRNILKLDVTRWDKWSTGEGVISLGKLPTQGYTRVSNTRTYIAGVVRSLTSIEILKIVNGSLERLGEFTFQGSVDRFMFSADDNYITAVLESGEVMCVKILDVTSPNLSTEVAKLECAKNAVCKTQEKMFSDVRWTSMGSVKRDGRLRTDDTLYNFMKNYTKGEDKLRQSKASFPAVGTQEFSESMKFLDVFDENTKGFVPTINTTPLDLNSLLESRESKPLQPHPPTTRKPSKPSKSSIYANNISPPPSPPPPPPPPGVPPPPPPLPAAQKLAMPKNLKLYQEMPTEDREKKLDKTVEELNKKSSAMCSIS